MSNAEGRMPNGVVGAEAKASGVSFQRALIVVIAAVGAAGTFLPWITVADVGTVDGTAGDGWISLVLFAMVVALAAIGRWAYGVRGGKRVIIVILSLLALALGVFEIINAKQAPAENEAEFREVVEAFRASIKIGIGLYAIVFAGLSGMVVPFLIPSKRRGKP